jgi:hypothetical protein
VFAEEAVEARHDGGGDDEGCVGGAAALQRDARWCRSREHVVTCRGVLAPAAGLRSQVVPKGEVEERKV